MREAILKVWTKSVGFFCVPPHTLPIYILLKFFLVESFLNISNTKLSSSEENARSEICFYQSNLVLDIFTSIYLIVCVGK